MQLATCYKIVTFLIAGKGDQKNNVKKDDNVTPKKIQNQDVETMLVR